MLLPLILAAGKLATSAYSAYGTKKLNDAQEAKNNAAQDALTAWYNNEHNRNYLGGTEAQSAIRNVVDRYKNQAKQDDAKAAIIGQTDDSRLANRNAMNNGYASFVNNLAARGDEYKRYVQGRFDTQKNVLDNRADNIYTNKINNWKNFASNATNALSSLGTAFAPTDALKTLGGNSLDKGDKVTVDDINEKLYG